MPCTLLLADKSPTIRRVIELTFADEEIAVTAAADGGEAIAAITACPPDIVLAGASMPPPDGYAVAAFVKGTPALAHIPVILLAPAFQPLDESSAAAAGCDAVLVTPFRPEHLLATVRQLLGASAGRCTETAEAAAEAPPEDIGEFSLEDRFDAIDAALSGRGPLPSREGETRPAALYDREEAFWCGPDGVRVSLEDFFDGIDEGSRGARPAGHPSASIAGNAETEEAAVAPAPADDADEALAALKRIFLTLLEASSGAPAMDDPERAARRLSTDQCSAPGA
jgi:twitching motility two-component system response regulator PilH